jgi:hypothetical protein
MSAFNINVLEMEFQFVPGKKKIFPKLNGYSL